jgi:tetratricopeptide (TPR) repeat protein
MERRLEKIMASLLLIFAVASRVDAQVATADKEKVMQFFQDQRYEDAIGYLAPLYHYDSTNLQILTLLGYANFMNEDFSIAENYYLKVFGMDSTNIAALQYLSMINAKQNTNIALSYNARLILLQPAKGTYYRQRGDLYRRLHENDSAQSLYKIALDLAPADIKNRESLAEMLIDTKKYSWADSLLDASPAKDSVNERLLELRCRSAYENKSYSRVLDPGERLMKLKDLHVTALTQLALSYYFLKRYNDCITVCHFLKDQDVVSESLYYYESRAQAKLKNYAGSNDLLQQCIRMAVSNTAESYYYDLGENYEALGKLRTAITQYDTAYYLFKNPVMKYNCGRIAETGLHNDALARKYYRGYLAAAKPKTPEEEKAYAYVKSKWKNNPKKPIRN